MEVIKKEVKLCVCCMEEHEVFTVKEHESTVFKGKNIEYEAIYEYCENCDEFSSTEEMLSQNDIALKNAYRMAMGLLVPEDIIAIRQKYGISQTDLSILLKWGEKTITRYESHQIQDPAHDTILRKLDKDPAWFLEFLGEAKDKLPDAAYNKYYKTAAQLYESSKDQYLRKSIEASYAKYNGDIDCCGGMKLNIDKVIDVITYVANSPKTACLYTVKLMKMLWYADALSFKRHHHSITGLVYESLPMGAAPIGYKTMLGLKEIEYDEEDSCYGYPAKHFKPSLKTHYPTLTKEDIAVLDTIIEKFGQYTKDQIVKEMHSERAYIETAPRDIIQFQYAKYLSID